MSRSAPINPMPGDPAAVAARRQCRRSLKLRAMLDHLSIATDAEPFYDAVMEALGHPKVGPGRYGVRNTAQDDGHTYLRAGGGAHVALRARTREDVDRFHAAGLAHGGRDDGAPGERPDYHPGYYAAFLVDPSGN